MRLPTIQLAIGPKLILGFMTVVVLVAVVGYLGTRTSGQVRQSFDLATAVDDILLKSLARDVAVSEVINSSDLRKLAALQEDIEKLDQEIDTLVGQLVADSGIKTVSDLTVFLENEGVYSDIEGRILQRHEELLAQGLIFTARYPTEKAQRYEVRTPIFESNDPELIKAVGQMQYLSKEALYQYRDQKHLDEWLESIDQVVKGVRSTQTGLSPTKRQEILDQLTAYGQTAQEMGQIAIREKEIRSDEATLIADLRNLNTELETVRNRIANELKTGIVASMSSDRQILMGAIVAALVLAVGTGLLISRSIAVPIKDLTTMAGEISRGNLDAGIQMVNSKDEIGQLSASFNLMAGQLRTVYGGLEQEVADRTQELSNANTRLEMEIIERRTAAVELAILAASLERSNRELEQFASVASHDLQEPLRKVQAFGERLNAEFSQALTGRGQDYLNRMLNASERMQTLINDLLTLSLVTSKGDPFVPVDLAAVVGGVLDDLEPTIEEVSGRIEVSELPIIDGDPTQMRQLIQNLVSNSLKFRKAGGEPIVKIRGQLLDGPSINGDRDSSRENLVQLTVEDNGIGFDEKHIDRIFNVFQRLHGRGQYPGTGIGLAVCRKIVERHGGTITAMSKPGQGATFIVTLPVKQLGGEKEKWTETVGLLRS